MAQEWLKWQQENCGMNYANSMSISTCDSLGRPSSRIVLLKEITPEGFVFFSNYNSRKGQELAKNPYIAANFYWDANFKQIKIHGIAQKTTRQENVDYWITRPRESQISQFVSQQSQPVDSRATLEKLYKDAEKKLENKNVPCPEHWGGYLIKPYEIEFWIGREYRFHDRYLFSRNEAENWLGQRLFP